MTRKQRRLLLIATCLSVLGLAVGLVLYAVEDSIAFFYTPSKAAEMQIQPGQKFRLGGLVKEGSLKKGENTKVNFAVTDTQKTIEVTYDGILPDLFKEGQGVVTEGRLGPDGRFLAESVLAKHDEKYVPREVTEALKEQGVWKGEGSNKSEKKSNP